MRDEVDELALEAPCPGTRRPSRCGSAAASPRVPPGCPEEIASREPQVLEVDDRLSAASRARLGAKRSSSSWKARDRTPRLFQRGLLEPLAGVLVRGGSCSAALERRGRRRAPARCPPPRSARLGRVVLLRVRCARVLQETGGLRTERGQRVLEARALAQFEDERATRRAQRLVDAREHPAQAASTVRCKKAKALRLAAGAEPLERALKRLAAQHRGAGLVQLAKPRISPTPNGCAFRRRLQKPWIVEIQAPSSSRARSCRPRSRSAAGSGCGALPPPCGCM